MNRVKFLSIIILLLSFCNVYAKKDEVVKRMLTWKISDDLGLPDSIQPDTTYINYNLYNSIDRNSIANSYNGNLVSPIQSKIYFDRYTETDFLFSHAYNPYIITSTDVVYYNTTTPYSNITYRTGGTNYREEDHINFIFTSNSNKHTNFGVTMDYLYPRGEYAQQSAKRFAGTLFGSHNGRNYKAYGNVVYNSLNNFENGGLVNPNDLTSPVARKDIPVKLNPSSSSSSNVLSEYQYYSAFYHHKYSLGIERDVKINEDSTTQVFVPVTTFAHTLKVDNAAKRYSERVAVNDFYRNTYSENKFTNDTAAVLTVKNTLSATFEEEFNTLLKFGATVYAENEVQRFVSENATNDTTTQQQWLNSTKAGGILSKRQGKFLKYEFGGDIYLIGYKLGDFKLHGDLQTNLKLGKDTLSINANAYVKNEEPSYFLQNYKSNHFRWNNNFDKTYRTYMGGEIKYPSKHIDAKLNVGFESIGNHIYFDTIGIPIQHNGNIQVLAADLQLHLKSKHFALENSMVYQLSSSKYLPLPTLSLLHNIYYHDCWFGVLYPQIGVNMRMHTAYYAPLLMPATGQFCIQDKEQIGNYPVMNAYANFRLKTVRFYIEYTHFNQLFMQPHYFSMPGYALNPALLKFGLSWEFYD